MFIEPNISGEKRGTIEVICGSMFSGKTEELIRRLKRAKIANQKVEIFKPAIDTRYDETAVVSHDANSIHSTPIDNSQIILLMAQGVDVVGISGGKSHAPDGNDALNALLALGYNEREAVWAIKQLPEGLGVSDSIKQALKFLSKA